MDRHLHQEQMNKSLILVSLMFLIVCLSFRGISEKRDINVSIYPTFNNEKLIFNTHQYITAQKDTLSITTFKFYISNITLEFEDGTIYKESKSQHLIDLEIEKSLKFQLKDISNKNISKVMFTIGIDSLTNVSGNLEGDLDPAFGMYWAWNSGYINMKLEGKSSSCTSLKKNFQYHIGGYLPKQNASQMITLHINRKNAPIVIQTDVAKWLNKVALKDTPSIMIPGPKAIAMSNWYKEMFGLYDEE